MTEKRNRILAILFFCWSALLFIATAYCVLIPLGAVDIGVANPASLWPIVFILLILTIFVLITAVTLLKESKRSQQLARVGAIASLFSFPVGTALGVYTLIVLRGKRRDRIKAPIYYPHKSSH